MRTILILRVLVSDAITTRLRLRLWDIIPQVSTSASSSLATMSMRLYVFIGCEIQGCKCLIIATIFIVIIVQLVCFGLGILIC